MLAPTTRIAFRGDDAGSCPSANEAVVECLRAGVLKNASLMIPGPAFAAGAASFCEQKACYGVHITLNSEWDNVKWGPVLPASEVPSLVDKNGHFFPTPNHLHDRGFSLGEAEREIRAQIKAGRDAGISFAYIDEHMGVAWLPGLRDIVQQIATETQLLLLPPLTNIDGALPLIDQLETIAAGDYLLVTHPGCDADDMHAMSHAGLAPGQIAHERDSDRRQLTDPALARRLSDLNIHSVRFDEL